MRSSGERGEGWFAGIYAAHYPDLVRYGLRRLADLDASTGLAQEVFIVAWRRRTDVPDPCLPWLYGVGRRLVANLHRAEQRRPSALPINDTDAVVAHVHTVQPDSAAALIDLHVALATLPDTDQEILRLIGWEQLSLAEAAAVLDCTRTAAGVRLHRARRRLTAAMTEPTSATVFSRTPAQL